MNRRIQTLMVLSILTSFGSSLSAIGSFLAIGRLFHDLTLVALALSLKTLSGVVFNRWSRNFALKRGIYTSLQFSQWVGVPILLALGLGYHLAQPMILLAAVFLTGIPGNLLNLVLAPMIKEIADSEDEFKKWQGLQQTFLGFGSLLAGFLSPWFLDHASVYTLYGVDAVTFLVAGAWIWRDRLWYREKFNPSLIPTTAPKALAEIKDRAEWIALLYIVPSFVFCGLIPVVASSGSAHFAQDHGLLERLWMAEAFSNIAMGWVYFRFGLLRMSKTILWVPLFCTAPLGLLFFTSNPILFYASFLIFGLVYLFGFTRYRDDLISSAQDLSARLHHSAFHLFLTNLLRTISPMLVSFLVTTESRVLPSTPLRAVVGVQILMGTVSAFALWKIKRRSLAAEIERPIK